jgi:hypothetical protein
MDSNELRKVAGSLRRIAREIEDTAIGSSRVSMYKVLAGQLNYEASYLETLANMEIAKKAEMRHG